MVIIFNNMRIVKEFFELFAYDKKGRAIALPFLVRVWHPQRFDPKAYIHLNVHSVFPSRQNQ